LQACLGGRVLFTRSQTGLMATAAAHELRPHAEDMAAAAAAFVRMGSGNLEETAGVVRLAAADVVGVEVLPVILAEFRYKYPNTVVELSLSNQMADLLRRDADIAVRMVRPKQKALLAKRAGTVALGFHAHRRYLERFGYPERLEDLARHTLIGFDRTLPFANLLNAVPLPVSRELFAFRCDNDLAQLAALRSGFGIGICQAGIARRDPNLLPLLGKQFKLDMEIWIVMHNDLKGVSRMRLMFDHLALELARFAAL
jgi:DNA-binding transcriptional LysR family regulator